MLNYKILDCKTNTINHYDKLIVFEYLIKYALIKYAVHCTLILSPFKNKTSHISARNFKSKNIKYEASKVPTTASRFKTSVAVFYMNAINVNFINIQQWIKKDLKF